MQFDAVAFLDGLFSGAQPDGTTMVPEGTAVVSAGEPDTDVAARFAGWVYRQDATGRWGWEAPDLPEWHRWWAHPENVIEPGEPCPRCGSLEKWWDLTGGEHCQRCEGDKLARARRFAEKAARLRGAASSGKREIQRNRS